MITVRARRDRDGWVPVGLLHHAGSRWGVPYRKHEALRGGESNSDTVRAELRPPYGHGQRAPPIRLSAVPARVRAAAVSLVAASMQLGDTGSRDVTAAEVAVVAARTAHDVPGHAVVAYLRG
ncbi:MULTISPECIES: hypothetical protein [Streptomyces]|uniref:Uncharacterized protein n=1 Tax=Streptomyces doudnae TaxID=3075536 RepID=A0ABD5F0D6_9ACTN|nr:MULTISPECIES: hypothetical protein [unclassified Streptomyces]MDT0440380.1 hypothetical protein [Streptomyces sp. DSM 41981]MYQ68596.1 hypothetical protein [Streptomyces sp. SID4950]SCE47472.1 hypothetical protein GA0115242_139923 [Streptomyces sp. SolWspMP-5a-2]